jgi:hypothetical protein
MTIEGTTPMDESDTLLLKAAVLAKQQIYRAEEVCNEHFSGDVKDDTVLAVAQLIAINMAGFNAR